MKPSQGPLTGGATVGLIVALGFLASWALQVVFASLAVTNVYKEPQTQTTNSKLSLIFTWLTLGLTLYIMFYSPRTWGWFQYLFIALASLAAAFSTVLVVTQKTGENPTTSVQTSAILSVSFAGAMGLALVTAYNFML